MNCCTACICEGPQRAKVAIRAASQASVCGDGLSEEVGGISCQHYLIVLWQQVYLAQAPPQFCPSTFPPMEGADQLQTDSIISIWTAYCSLACLALPLHSHW